MSGYVYWMHGGECMTMKYTRVKGGLWQTNSNSCTPITIIRSFNYYVCTTLVHVIEHLNY